MAISLACAQNHVENWTQRLSRFPTRAQWPQHLFHSAQLEVAVEIISSGHIACRNQVPALLCDVANQGALWNNPNAHDYVRLYFRPKNSFHLKTEGIKSLSDPHRQATHMSIPIAFAFGFVDVMSLQSSFFVTGNFARTSVSPASGDRAFTELDFSKIYHDSPMPRDRMEEIHNARMSEVVVSSALSLNMLKAVICRTVHEERMLRYYLNERGVAAPRIFVEQSGSTFMRRGIFIRELYLKDNLLHLSFDSPAVYAQSAYNIDISRNIAEHTRRYSLSAGAHFFPELPAMSPDEVWRVTIEQCLAYHGVVPSVSGIVSANIG